MGLLGYLLVDRPRIQREEEEHELRMQSFRSSQQALLSLAEIQEFDPTPHLNRQDNVLPVEDDLRSAGLLGAPGGQQPAGGGGGQGVLPAAAPGSNDAMAQLESRFQEFSPEAASFVNAYGNFESGMRYDAVGNQGGKEYWGLAQIGPERRKDIGMEGVSKEEFLTNKSLQNEAIEKHVQLANQEIKRLGLDKYIGSEFYGVPVTKTGLVGVIQIAGAEGARRFFEEGHLPLDKNQKGPIDFLRLGYHGEQNTARPKLEKAPAGERVEVEAGPGGEESWQSRYYTWDDLRNTRFEDSVMKPAVGQFLDQATELFGKKFQITSGFRTKEHNAKQKGAAKNSRHTHGDAVDISVGGMETGEKAKLVRSLRAAGATGIGIYKGHIHADVRPTSGNVATWGQWPKWAKDALAQGDIEFAEAHGGLDQLIADAPVDAEGHTVQQLQDGQVIPPDPAVVNPVASGPRYRRGSGDRVEPIDPSERPAPQAPDPEDAKVIAKSLRQSQGGAWMPDVEAVGLRNFQAGYSGKEYSRYRHNVLKSYAQTGDIAKYLAAAEALQTNRQQKMQNHFQAMVGAKAIGNRTAFIEHAKAMSWWMDDGAIPVFDTHPNTGDIVVRNYDEKTGQLMGSPYVLSDDKLLETLGTALLDPVQFLTLTSNERDKQRRFEIDEAKVDAERQSAVALYQERRQRYQYAQVNQAFSEMKNTIEIRQKLREEQDLSEADLRAYEQISTIFQKPLEKTQMVTDPFAPGEMKEEVIEEPMTAEVRMLMLKQQEDAFDLYMLNKKALTPGQAAGVIATIYAGHIDDPTLGIHLDFKEPKVTWGGNVLKLPETVWQVLLRDNAAKQQQKQTQPQTQPAAGQVPKPPAAGELPVPGAGLLSGAPTAATPMPPYGAGIPGGQPLQGGVLPQ